MSGLCGPPPPRFLPLDGELHEVRDAPSAMLGLGTQQSRSCLTKVEPPGNCIRRGRPCLTIHPDLEPPAVPGLAFEGPVGSPCGSPLFPQWPHVILHVFHVPLFMGRAALMGPKRLLSRQHHVPSCPSGDGGSEGVASTVRSVRASMHFQCHRAACGAAASVRGPALVTSFPGAHWALGLRPFTGRTLC